MSEYTKRGGGWLGAARSWIQWNCRNGSDVTWGSNTVLNPPITAAMAEDFAAHVANAAFKDADEMDKKLEDAKKKRLDAEIALSHQTDRIKAAIKDLRAGWDNSVADFVKERVGLKDD